MTNKTNTLKAVVQAHLKTVCGDVYYRHAKEDAMYPHIVFSLKSVNIGDFSLDDVVLTIDIWDRSRDTRTVDNYADLIEDMFRNNNDPQETILPTFFTTSRGYAEDPDREIQHLVLNCEIQNYER